MTFDTVKLDEQMQNSRFRSGRFERLENGEWVEWPVLRLDPLASKETKRAIAQFQSQGLEKKSPR